MVIGGPSGPREAKVPRGSTLGPISRRMRLSGNPTTPTAARNTDPAAASGALFSRVVVTKSWSSRSPPKVHAVTWDTGTSTTPSSTPSGR